jgi:hypothetical protein
MLPSSRLKRLGPLLAGLVLLAALAPIALPFTGPDFPQGHDATAHLTNTYRFDRAFGQGQIPVRWVEGIQHGRGQPLFNFYQAGFYYLVELLHRLGLQLSVAFRAAPVLLWWLGAAFMYLLLRPYGMAAAIAGTVAFALSPYLIVDVFVRAAYPEFAAIVFAVGTLWAADSFLRSGRRRSVALAAFLCGLMLICHLPATLIAAPMIAAHIAYTIVTVPGAKVRTPWLVAALAIGAGLATFYLLPALTELPLIGIDRLTEGRSDFHRHFVPLLQSVRHVWSYSWNYSGASVTDPADLMPAHVNLVQWMSMLAALVAIFVGVARRGRGQARTAVNTPGVAAVHANTPTVDGVQHNPSLMVRGLLAWLGVALLSLFMMSAVSAPVWDALPPLAFIQFPWRFFLLMSIAGGVLVAMVISTLHSRTARVIALIFVAGVQFHLYERRLKPARFIPYAEMMIDDPRWADTPVAQRVGFTEIAYDPIGTGGNTPVDARWTIVDGAARAQLVRGDDARLVLAVSGPEPSRVRVNTPAFAGWRVRIDGVDAAVGQEPGSGYMVADVPPGAHLLEARLEDTPVRRAANIVSLVSLLLLPAVVFGCRAQTRRAIARSASLDLSRQAAWRRLLAPRVLIRRVLTQRVLRE